MERAVKDEFRQMVHILVDKRIDFFVGEFFNDVIEAEWALECLLEGVENMGPVGGGEEERAGVATEANCRAAVAVTMSIGSAGDFRGVSPQECAVRLVKAGLLLIVACCCCCCCCCCCYK